MGNCCDMLQSSTQTDQVNKYNTQEDIPKMLVHLSSISQVAICGQFTVSALKNNDILCYNHTTKKLVGIFNAHQNDVTKICAKNANCQPLFATASRDKSIVFWNMLDNLLTNDNQISDAHEFVITGLDLSNDSHYLVSGSRDNTIKMWDTETLQCVAQQLVSRNLVTHIKWAKNSAYFVQSSEDKEMKVWDSRTMTVSHSFGKKDYIQTWCDISEDASICVSCSNGFSGTGCEVTLWDIRNKKILHEMFGHEQSVNSVCFFNNYKYVCSGSSDKSVRLWCCESGQETAQFYIDSTSGPVNCVESMPSENKLVAGTFDAGVFVFQINSNNSDLTVENNY